MTLGNMREVGVQRLCCLLPQRGVQALGADRRLKLPSRDGTAAVPSTSEVREVRREERGCTAELERAGRSLTGKQFR